MIDDVLNRAGEQWRAAQPPPVPMRHSAHGVPVGSAVPPSPEARPRWSAPRLWAPVAALACVAAVIAAVALPLAWRGGTAPGLVGSPPTAATRPPALPADLGDGIPVRGTGMFVRPANGPLQFCELVRTTVAWADLSSDPQTRDIGCGAVSVLATGVDDAVLSNRSDAGQRFSDRLTVRGRLHNGVLDVESTGPALTDPTPPYEQPTVFPAPCPAPAGGWPTGYGPGNGDVNALSDYVRAHDTEFNDLWQAQPDGFTGPSMQPISAVYVVGTTGDVEAARAQLTALYSGNLCVHPVAHSAADLNRVANQLNSVSVVAIVAMADTMLDAVRVSVVALDERTTAVLAAFSDMTLVIEPPLLGYDG